jgi:hypothetical protein
MSRSYKKEHLIFDFFMKLRDE